MNNKLIRLGVVRSAILLTFGEVLSKSFGFFRELVFAYRFGASPISDAFFVVNSIPSVLLSAIAIAVNVNFIPVYLSIHNFRQQRLFVINLVNICAVLSLIGCVILNVFPSQVLSILTPSLCDEVLLYSITLLHIVSFSIFPIIMGKILQSYVQANEMFISTAMYGVVTNVVIIFSFLIAGHDNYYIIGVGVLVSHLMGMLLFYYEAHSVGFRYSWNIDVCDDYVRMMVSLAIPLMVARISEDASLLVDRNLAANLGIGLISSMSYADLLVKSINSMIIGSIVVAIFPSLSQLAADKDKNRFSVLFQKYFHVIFFIICPISAFMCFFSDDIVMCVFQHGALQMTSATIIWECTTCYAVGILPFGIQNYLVRGFYSFRETRKVAYIIISSLCSNIVLSILGAKYFGYIGISIATSISYFGSCLILSVLFTHEHDINIFGGFYKNFISFVMISFFLAGVIKWFFQKFCLIDFLYVRLLGELFFFFLIYGVIFFITHRTIFREIICLFRNRGEVGISIEKL